jgi:pimeloyl-ACP methyl ester carboxylesterase
MRNYAFLIAMLMALPSHAGDAPVRIDTRPGVQVPIYLMKRDAALATVLLLPGGDGEIGESADGAPSSRNFLVRSRDYFAEAGFNVAIAGRASDKRELDYPDRIAADHIEDLGKVVDVLKKELGLPVWLVGTSRGTVSTTAAAIAFGNDRLAGIVLTSSVTSFRRVGAVPRQDLAAIRIPVLVVHHEQDACTICRAAEVPYIIDGLRNAPVRKKLIVRGGENPTGDPCEALHYHGFIGQERQVVGQIAAWIRRPMP